MRFLTSSALLLGLSLLPLGDAAAQLERRESSNSASDVQKVASWVRAEGNPSSLGHQRLPMLWLGPESLGNVPTRNKS